MHALRSTLLLLVLPGALAAQATGGIRGRTLEGGVLPLGGVEVLVDGVPRSVLSGPTGTFLLDGLPPGEYQVTARMPGFTPARMVVGVRAGVILDIELHLQRAAQELDSVQVVAPIGVPFLLGSVHDTFGRPLENVEIVLRGVSRTAVTGPSGRFRFDSLPVGIYQLTARYPGYVAAQSQVPVRQGGTEVALRLRAFTQVLETVEVVGDRRGLYGVVATAALLPIPGAAVRVHGGGTGQVTDSAGRFAFVGLRSGDYLLAVAATLMEPRSLMLQIPRNGRLEVSVTMEYMNPSRRRPPGAEWENHQLGLLLSFNPSRDRLARAELDRHRGRLLCDVPRIRQAAGGLDATIVVNGLEVLRPWSLCAFSVDEVAVIHLPPTGRGRVAHCTALGQPVVPAAGTRCFAIWTR